MRLENQEKGDYTIYLKPEITLSNMSFIVTHPDLDKRKVFADLRFRQAMSMAINRDEINDVALFGQGTPKQYTGFSPLPCLLYTSPSPRDLSTSRMPSSA